MKLRTHIEKKIIMMKRNNLYGRGIEKRAPSWRGPSTVDNSFQLVAPPKSILDFNTFSSNIANKKISLKGLDKNEFVEKSRDYVRGVYEFKSFYATNSSKNSDYMTKYNGMQIFIGECFVRAKIDPEAYVPVLLSYLQAAGAASSESISESLSILFHIHGVRFIQCVDSIKVKECVLPEFIKNNNFTNDIDGFFFPYASNPMYSAVPSLLTKEQTDQFVLSNLQLNEKSNNFSKYLKQKYKG